MASNSSPIPRGWRSPNARPSAALLALLTEAPLDGRMVSMDAGFLNAAVTQTIVQEHGNCLGGVKGDQAECRRSSMTGSPRRCFSPPDTPPAPLPVALDQIAPPRRKRQPIGFRRELQPRRAPDAQTIEQSRGRLEIRELWVVDAGDVGPSLMTAYGWRQVTQIGGLRRWCRRRHADLWTVEEVTVVSSRQRTPAQFLASIRNHWTIENQVHRPRDGSMQEDRLHGRAIGVILAVCRNVVINLIRRHLPGRYIPTARNAITTDLGIALRWMHLPLRN